MLTTVDLRCRLVFLLMYSFAAVGLDAARVADQAFKTGCVEDCHVQRNAAVRMVDADILHLLRCTTPYTLATVYSEVLAQLVFLRRALTTSAGQCALFLLSMKTWHVI